LVRPSNRAPPEVQVYDRERGVWAAVRNPGIIGWEVFAPR
jgi:hypothetical protein